MTEESLRRPHSGIATPVASAAGASGISSRSGLSNHPKYRPDIDGLRAVAVLAVIGFHAAPGRVPGGFIGVDIFFVISGFLITTIILKGLENERFSIFEFYRRRIRRIFPALLLLLFACLVAGYFFLLDDEFEQLGKHVAAGAGFVANLVYWSESGYFDNAAIMKPLLHLWSLGVEEQFYIVWPLLLWFTFKQRYDFLKVAFVIAALSFAVNIYQSYTDPVAAFYSPFTRFWELMMGSVLAYIGLKKNGAFPNAGSRLSDFNSFVGVALVVIGIFLINDQRAFPGWWALLPTVGTVLVVWAGPNALLNRFVLSNKALVFVGLISYPLYLWHWPILSFLRILEGGEIVQWKRVVAVAAAFVLAALTYRFVEIPVRRGVRTRAVPLLLGALMGLAILIGCYGYFGNGFEGRSVTPRIVNAGEIGHYPFFDYVSRHAYPCTPLNIQKDADDWQGFVRCFQSQQTEIKDVVLLGDSHAEHLFPGLADRLHERNVVYYGKGGLPFLDNKEFDRIFKHVLGDKSIDMVLISANWDEKLKGYPQDQWRRELLGTVVRLIESGKTVYLIEDAPDFSFNPSRCKYAGRLGLENKCTERDSHSNMSYMPVFEALASETPGLKVIRIHDRLCRRGSCSMAKDGVLYFRDNSHFNVLGSKALADVIVEQIPRGVRDDALEMHNEP